MPKSIIFLVVVFFSLVAIEGLAQDKQEIIQLSGVIIGEDSISGIPGAHIYSPRSGRGTVSNQLGYFSIPILKTDSVIISSIGYDRVRYVVPHTVSKQFVTIIVRMNPSTTALEGIEIMPFPTETAFKDAILALNLPSERGMTLGVLDAEEFALMVNAEAIGSYSNYRYYTDQYLQSVDDRFRGRTNPFLDPFNWYYFFRSLKRNKESKK